MTVFVVAPVGPPATRNHEPRQARKGATVVMDVCAGMWLAGAISISGTKTFPFSSATIVLTSMFLLALHHQQSAANMARVGKSASRVMTNDQESSAKDSPWLARVFVEFTLSVLRQPMFPVRWWGDRSVG